MSQKRLGCKLLREEKLGYFFGMIWTLLTILCGDFCTHGSDSVVNLFIYLIFIDQCCKFRIDFINNALVIVPFVCHLN